MDPKCVIFDILSQALNGVESYICSIEDLLEFYPKLETCDFEELSSNDITRNRYTLLYHCFMLLFCSTSREGKLIDTVNEFVICEECDCWEDLMMLTYFYFKQIFPAALLFFTNAVYNEKSAQAKNLILSRFLLIHREESELTQEYDLCEVFLTKLKLLNHKVTHKTSEGINIINNVHLSRDTVFPQTTQAIASITEFDANHILNEVYPSYSGVVMHRRIKQVKTRIAQTKYSHVFKLRYKNTVSHENSFIVFDREKDLVTMILLHNVIVSQSAATGLTLIAVPKTSRKCYSHQQYLFPFFDALTHCHQVKRFNRNLNDKSTHELLEKTGFISMYDIPESSTLAYVKNRVVHFTASFKTAPTPNPMLVVKDKALIIPEKVVKTMTITRYKTETFHDNNISFNVNYQGSVSHLQFMISKFVNEYLHLGCQLNSEIWVSNVCTTSDTMHAGIQNTHTYRQECLQNQSRLSHLMINFPGMVTLVNDSRQYKTNGLIKHRTTINTSRLFGQNLKQALANNVDFMKTMSEHDDSLTKLFYAIEKHYQELLPRNVVLLIHLLHLFEFSSDSILELFEHRLLCSRMFSTTYRAFSRANNYIHKYKSDAVDSTSIKSSKYLTTSPPTISRKQLFTTYRQSFPDIGSVNYKIYRPRGRNANLIDLILFSKDKFFFSQRCHKLLTLLLRKNAHRPVSKLAIELLIDHQRQINSSQDRVGDKQQ